MDNKSTPEKIPKYFCGICDYYTSNSKDFNKHLSTQKHLRITMDNQKYPKLPPKKSPLFFCEKCDYVTCDKKNYNKHLLTEKHKRGEVPQKIPKTTPEKSPIICTCGKVYKYNSGLSKHKKLCNIYQDEIKSKCVTADNKIDANLVRELIEHNKDLQQQLLLTNSVITNNNTNHNHFNISVFLNEQCKNAVNFDDFIDNIRISHEDLENNARLGFVDGISKIIMDNLNQLTLTERPIHCTDVKRDTIYLKHENKWKKDKPEVKEILDKSIRSVSYKSIGSLIQWKQVHPDYADPDSDFSNLSLIIHKQSLPGFNRENNYQKIIHNLAKQNVIDKDQAI